MKAITGSGCRQHHDHKVPSFSNPLGVPLSRISNFPHQQQPWLLLPFKHLKGLKLSGNGLSQSNCGAVNAVYGRQESYELSWDDQPFEILPNGKKAYMDEQDVVTFLDPPKELTPLDSASYNPASYLWKKIEDIPEERRHRLLHSLKPRLVSRAWEVAGTRYGDPKLAKQIASKLLSNEDDVMLEFYNFRISGGPVPIAWMNLNKKAIFSCKEEKAYGRLIGGSVLAAFANSITPLYFMVTQLKEVMSTEQTCDLAYEFGDGLFDIHDLPQGFPRPVKHPYPFNDQVVIYVRYLGPGVSVGQAWQEGMALEQVPRKLCGEIFNGERLC
ncbi:WD repeat-containing protein 49 isoform 1 [Quillaja saponaria]|uniref:WD repeat-containing protein 49 isoform 1 n=1 Tax=Quillaja saponaria TaxID=32244 RepID=A0AAD7PDV7_QUISA|nr:WD repeat-containing protein 49 isoform 1 [Quillaja saponaria]